MRKINRILSILLILTLLLPGFTFAEDKVSLTHEQMELYGKVLEKVKSNNEAKIDEKYDEIFKPEDEVRIIVELVSDPSIVYATERNLGYNELSSNKIDDLERNIKLEQERVKADIISERVDIEFINSFTTAFNGFSGKVKYEDIELIERLPSVKKVYISNEYEKPDIKPDMNSSNDMIGSIPTWNTGYEGEGMVIAIIDTGIDPGHRDMVLSQATEPRLSIEDIEGKDLLGRYYTEKVPYGYNYYDLNNEIRDLGPGASMHGMHVAGTAGANGDVNNGGIKGVAPEAQLLAMKVFSNDPIYATTFSDIYLVAIDEAIKLGADVLNMSLGSTASFYIPESAEDIALRNATENGIVCAVSAGNSGSMTYGWTATNSGFPWVENPDIGVVGAPGLNKSTIQVASIENTHQKANSLTYTKDGKTHEVAMAIAGDINPADLLQGEQEFVNVEDASPEFLTDVVGKVVIAVRGGNTGPFVDKIQNAQNAGAAAIIVRNHQSGGEELINMATPDVQTIPAVFIGYTDGMALLELEDKKVTFTNDFIGVPNPNAYEMSDFTSWGVTPSLEFKPEITAPGGQIFSTLNDDQYGMMSGTSMAAPHVAGGSALIMEYIKEHEVYGNLSLAEQTKLAKVLLMNTATIMSGESNVLSYDKFIYSPRRQGAGLMNLYGAINTPVRVVDAGTGEGKVELKDFENTEFTMSFTAINATDTDATYDVDVSVLTDYIYYNALNLLSSDEINASVDKPDTITVPANDEVTFEITVDIGTDNSIYRNMFVEGFVTLVDPDDNNPELSVPYVGFYGDWGEPEILDGMRFIDPAGYSYFNRSGMIYWDINDDGYFYARPRMYMSTGTVYGMFFGTDNVTPYLSFMRNAEEVSYNILDGEGNNLRTILTQQYVRKNFINGGRNQPVRFIWDAEWDGTVKGQYLPDGDYFYEITAKVHYDGAEFQSKRIPITIDTVEPVIENMKVDPKTKKLTWDVVEANGIELFMITVNDVDLDDIPGKPGKTSYELDLSNYMGEVKIQIVPVDYAMNIGYAEIETVLDNADSFIYIISPNLFSVYDRSEVIFEGYVTNFNELEKVMINDSIEADIEYIENAVVRHPDDPSTIIYTGPAYKFTKVVSLEDGYQEARIEAISRSGATSSLVRRFFVDTTPPELEITTKSINHRTSKAELEITMRDNLGYLRLLLDDSQIYEYDHPLVEMGPTEKTFTYEVKIKDGENSFDFTLTDIADHVTTLTHEVNVEAPIISNVEPAIDAELKVGDTLDISFDAPAGGQGYYKIMLPFDVSVNEYGTPMTEESPGFYKATWTIPRDFEASNLLIEIRYIGEDGVSSFEIAEGTVTIVKDINNLPKNSVIIGNKAFDIRYLDTNEDAQEILKQWTADVYVKLNENTLVNSYGSVVSFDVLPDRLEYFDIDGNSSVYKK